METSLKQAAILSVIAAHPGINGPALHQQVQHLIPLIQFPQHISRLRKRGFITTERCPSNRQVVEMHLSAEGHAELESLLQILAFVQKNARKRPNVSR
jgi:DNA-binding MarR family transcriptional regulator